MEGETLRVELFADEIEHLANARLLVIDDVLVAHAQVAEAHLAR
jgi:hypothetical protein